MANQLRVSAVVKDGCAVGWKVKCFLIASMER